MACSHATDASLGIQRACRRRLSLGRRLAPHAASTSERAFSRPESPWLKSTVQETAVVNAPEIDFAGRRNTRGDTNVVIRTSIQMRPRMTL